MKLKPDEFWNMTLIEFNDMMNAFIEEEIRQDDVQNQRTSWFTAHIMNSSGNMRRAIKPTDLYKPLDYEEQQKVEQKVIKRFESPEQKEQYLKNLMAKFDRFANMDSSQ